MEDHAVSGPDPLDNPKIKRIGNLIYNGPVTTFTEIVEKFKSNGGDIDRVIIDYENQTMEAKPGYEIKVKGCEIRGF